MKWLLNTTNLLLILILVLLVAVLLRPPCCETPPTEPPTEPPTAGACPGPDCPRLEWANFEYRGGVRMPADTAAFSYAQTGGMDFDPVTKRLYVSDGYHLCEMDLPAPVINENPAALPQAKMTQACVRPGEGRLETDMGTSDIKLANPLRFGEYVYQSVYWYFDANADQVKTHFRHAPTLSTTGAYQGIVQVSTAPATEAGWISTIMGHIPEQWRGALKGKALAGGGGIPIINRQPYGFSLYSFDPAAIHVAPEPVPSVMVLGHDSSHPLGVWGAQSEMWNGSTVMHGVVVFKDTRTTIIVGLQGTGPWCYGNGGPQNPPPPGENCYDPTNAHHGTHAYPYRYQIWAFDTQELADVAAGKRAAWDVQPAIWVPTFPTPSCCPNINGAAYNEADQLLYLMQGRGHGYDLSYPLIHTFKLNIPTRRRL